MLCIRGEWQVPPGRQFKVLAEPRAWCSKCVWWRYCYRFSACTSPALYSTVWSKTCVPLACLWRAGRGGPEARQRHSRGTPEACARGMPEARQMAGKKLARNADSEREQAHATRNGQGLVRGTPKTWQRHARGAPEARQRHARGARQRRARGAPEARQRHAARGAQRHAAPLARQRYN